MRIAALLVLASLGVTPALGQTAPDVSDPIHLRDRGTGVATSMFGTYIRGKELIVYPFYEYQRWRNESRALLAGLGEAIDAQFSRWNLTEAEREVALLLLKGLSLKEVAAIRATTDRTIRAQARSIYAKAGLTGYAKAGLTGRAALSAFFLEDLLSPIDTLK